MPNPENLIGKGFDKNPENINKNGRPKKIYTILKQMGYSKDDVNTCFGELIWYNEEELNKVFNDPEKPIITQITAKALLESKKSGSVSLIKDVLEQVLGRPNQKVEVETKTTVDDIDLSNATPEEIEMIAKLTNVKK